MPILMEKPGSFYALLRAGPQQRKDLLGTRGLQVVVVVPKYRAGNWTLKFTQPFRATLDDVFPRFLLHLLVIQMHVSPHEIHVLDLGCGCRFTSA